MTGWIVRRLGNNIFTCFARFSGNSIEHTSFIDQIYNIGIANWTDRHQSYKIPGTQYARIASDGSCATVLTYSVCIYGVKADRLFDAVPIVTNIRSEQAKHITQL